MIHMTTGNKLDVVYDYSSDDIYLKSWDEKMDYKLADPWGLLISLQTVLKEKKEFKEKYNK